MKGLINTLVVSLTLLAGSTAVFAEDYVYGRELMTDKELSEHQAKMHSFKTEEEREAYRMAHHERMEQRAEDKGVALPSEAPAAGQTGGKGVETAPGHGGGMGMGTDKTKP